MDRLTENDLVTVLALPAHIYAPLLATRPDWIADLETLYSATNPCDGLPDVARDAGGDTRAFLPIAAPLLSEGLRRLRVPHRRKQVGRLRHDDLRPPNG